MIYEWWVSLDIGIRAAIISALATIVVGTVGAFVVVLQIGLQARAAIRQNRDNEALKLKVGIYQHILRACTVASDAELELSVFVRSFETNVSLYPIYKTQTHQPPAPKARYPRFSELNTAMHLGAVGLISIVEEWQIIDPRMEVFKIAINVVLHNIREAETAYAKKPNRASISCDRLETSTRTEHLTCCHQIQRSKVIGID